MRIGLTGFCRLIVVPLEAMTAVPPPSPASVAVELLLNPSTIVPGPLLKLPPDD